MPFTSWCWSLLSNLFRRRRVEADLDAELRAYLDQLTDEKIAAGASPQAARRAALLELGGLEQVKEEVRDARAGAWLDAAGQELRQAGRALVRDPGFSAVVVLALALGIGVNTAIFSVVNGLLYKPVPGVKEQERLAWFRASFSYPTFVELAEQQEVFSAMAAIGGTQRFSLTASGRAEGVTGELVTSAYFTALGAAPQLGRGFLPEEDRRNAAPTVVIGDGLWRRRFGADPGVVGRTVAVNGLAVRVVGVAPPGLAGTEIGLPRELWIPLALHPRLVGPSDDLFENGGDPLAARDREWLNVFGRLRPGVDLDEAQTATTTLAGRIADAHGDPDRDRRVRAATLLPVVGGLDPRDRLDAAGVAPLLMIIVGLVLLVACANVAGLLLARGVARARELGIRRALGASRGRLIRQLLVESLLLALLAGAAGLVIAGWTSQAIVGLAGIAGIGPLDVGLDHRVLGFTLGLCLLTAVASGLMPALHGSRADVMSALKHDGAAPAGTRSTRLRRALVVAQVALSLLLLVGAGLMTRSFATARAQGPGFAVEGALLVGVEPTIVRASEAHGRAFYRQLLAGAQALPGVEAASLVRLVPLSLSSGAGAVQAEGRAPGETALEMAGFNIVGPDHLRAMGIPLLRGRDFGPGDDAGAPPVAVIDEILARRLWPRGEDPLGRRLRLGEDGPWLQVIGVAAATKTVTLGEPARPFLYQPLLQHYQGAMTLVVRVRAGDPRVLAGPVAELIRGLEPDLPAAEVRTLAAQLDFALLPARLGMELLATLGLLALILASMGMYGLVAYAVKQRTYEIGVRLALGASRRDVMRLVTRETARVVALGAAIGLGLALVLTRTVAGVLVGVEASDPLAYTVAVLVLGGVALLASWLPARRALRVEPMIALRGE